MRRNERVYKGKNEVVNCPQCGSLEYYVKTIMKGETETHYRLDGQLTFFDEHGRSQTVYNGHIHDGLTYRDFKTAYCSGCHIKLGTVKETN